MKNLSTTGSCAAALVAHGQIKNWICRHVFIVHVFCMVLRGGVASAVQLNKSNSKVKLFRYISFPFRSENCVDQIILRTFNYWKYSLHLSKLLHWTTLHLAFVFFVGIAIALFGNTFISLNVPAHSCKEWQRQIHTYFKNVLGELLTASHLPP